MSDTANALPRVSLQALETGREYKVTPGMEFELTPGVWVMLNKPTIKLVKAWDKMNADYIKRGIGEGEKEQTDADVNTFNPDSDMYYLYEMARKVVLVCQLPANVTNADELLALDGLTTTPLKAIVNAFRDLK